MASTHSYVITVGTTPVPDGSLAIRRAARRGEVRRPAAHRAGAHRAARTAGGGRHRATNRRPTKHRPTKHRATDRRAAGHRATRRDVRSGRIIRTRENGLVLRAVVPLVLLVLVTVVFVSAWFSATGAEAFASIVKP